MAHDDQDYDLIALEDVRALVKKIPEVSVEDVSRYLFASGIILQNEAYKIVNDVQSLDSSRKMKRLHQIERLLSTAGTLLRDSAELKIKLDLKLLSPPEKTPVISRKKNGRIEAQFSNGEFIDKE